MAAGDSATDISTEELKAHVPINPASAQNKDQQDVVAAAEELKGEAQLLSNAPASVGSADARDVAADVPGIGTATQALKTGAELVTDQGHIPGTALSTTEQRGTMGANALTVACTTGGAAAFAAYDFSSVYEDKLSQYKEGTREWAFSELEAWLGSPGASSQLFWVMGAGGVGKSVLTAEFLRRHRASVAAWHFCRHDNKEQSQPCNLLRSLSAMLCINLDGYSISDDSNNSTDVDTVFQCLFEKPLKQLTQHTAKIIIIDALDEIPRAEQKKVTLFVFCERPRTYHTRVCAAG